MSTPPHSLLAPALDRTALFLTASSITLRWLAIGSTAGPGLNLILNLFLWAALGLWFLSRALSGGAVYRFSGMEFALLAFVIACLVSTLRASFMLAALDQAFSMLSYALLFVLGVQILGRRGILALLVPTALGLSIYALIQYWVYFKILLDGPMEEFPEELARRIQSREVFATFIGPNQFAAFLVLSLAVIAGRFLDSDRKGNRAVLEGVTALLALTALVMTGSMGGWVSLAAAAALFGGLALTRRRGRKGLVVSGGILIAALTGLLLFTPLLDALAGHNHSLYVRSVYWSSAGRIAAEHPVLGVGLDNYQEQYFQVKGDAPQETHRVHNDYLQILTDTGAIGLLSFGAILLLGLRRAFARAAEPADEPALFPRWLAPAAGGLAFLWFVNVGVQQGALLPLVTGAMVVGGWLGYVLVSARCAPGPSEERWEWTRIGAASGFVGLLIHMAVDFDLYEPGLGIALFLALSLVTAGQAPASSVRLPSSVCGVSAAVLFLVTVPLFLLVAARVYLADEEISATRRALQILSRRGIEDAESAERLVKATAVSESAQAHNPFDPEGYALFAQAKFFAWTTGRNSARESSVVRARLRETEGIVIQAMNNAIVLRPRSSPYHEQKARYHRAFHLFYRELRQTGSPRTSEYGAIAEVHLDEALRSQVEASRLYPTIWLNAYNLARLLDLGGHESDAEANYGEALRLSDRAAEEKWAVRRLQLPPVKRARCLLRTDRPDEAFTAVRDSFRTAYDALEPSLRMVSLKKEEARRLFGVEEDEYDSVLKPVIDAAIEAVTK